MSGFKGFENNMLTFRYEDGSPVDLPVNAKQLLGQDGWENIENGDIPVVSDVYVRNGTQSVYRGISGDASRLRRKVGVLQRNRDEILKVSAFFFYTGESAWQSHPNIISLGLDDIDGMGMMEFGIESMSEKAMFYTGIMDNTEGIKKYFSQYALKKGWYWIEAVIDQINRKVISVNATVVYEGLVPASCWEVIHIIPAPLEYNTGASPGDVHFIELRMGDDTIVDAIAFGGERIDFDTPEYSMEGIQIRHGALRTHKTVLPAVTGKVYAYCTFDMISHNPMPHMEGLQQGLQIVEIGQETGGRFIPLVRFGMTDGRNLGRGYLTTWVWDGKQDCYGEYIRPDTPYDFKFIFDLDKCNMSVWCRGRGEDSWFLMVEEIRFINTVKVINMVKVEQYPGAAGVSGFTAGTEKKAEYEALRAHPFAKTDRSVMEGAGYRFQPMRSVWRKPGRHVIIGRDPKRWLGFPTVVQTGPDTLVCAHNDGLGHGGGGGAFVRHSHDLGKTWSEALMVHPSAVNSPRLQKLKDGTLLLLADTYDSDLHISEGSRYSIVFYDSYDGGKTWCNQRWLDPEKAGGNESCVPSSVAELDDGSWLLAGSHFSGGLSAAWTGLDCEQLEFYRSKDRGDTWKLHSIYKPTFPYSVGEPTILTLPGGRLLMYMRENCITFPGHKAYSEDNGKTWELEELPYYVTGRTCAGFLRDGRVMLTTRKPYQGRACLGAWIGDPYDKTEFTVTGTHFNDAHSTGLKDGTLHIDNDGLCGQFTQYNLRYPDSPESTIDITACVKVISNTGHAATISVPYAGKLRIFHDMAEFTSDSNLSFSMNILQGEYHTYRMVCEPGNVKVFIDGIQEMDMKKADSGHLVRMPWTPSIVSHYQFTFGNEDIKPSLTSEYYPDKYMHGDVTGYSIWKYVLLSLDDPKTGKRKISWKASDGFPDQYQLDHIIEIDASVCGLDQGYSGWVELDDGRIFIVNYTDDTAPSLDGLLGVAYIRGTFLEPSDLSS